MINDKWVYSMDEEVFSNSDYFDTKEEAIEAGEEYAKDCGYSQYYVGQCKEFIPRVDAEDLIERMQEQAYEEVGEVTEDWLEDATSEAINELAEELHMLFQKWMKKYSLEPSFYRVEAIDSYSVRESEVNVHE